MRRLSFLLIPGVLLAAPSARAQDACDRACLESMLDGYVDALVLVRIANLYFSGIERNDGRGAYPIADSCARLETAP